MLLGIDINNTWFDVCKEMLRFVDFMSLFYVSKQVRRSMKQIEKVKYFAWFKEVIHSRVEAKYANRHFKDQLRMCKTVLANTEGEIGMSGSFVLDCIMNTNYHNDIDVYIQATATTTTEYQINLTKIFKVNDMSYFKGTLQNANDFVLRVPTPRDREVIGISPSSNILVCDDGVAYSNAFEEFVVLAVVNIEGWDTEGRHSTPIQLISIRDTLSEQVKMFDINLVKNSFSGKHGLQILCPYDIVYRTTVCKMKEGSANFDVAKGRCDKYRKRGFKISFVPIPRDESQ